MLEFYRIWKMLRETTGRGPLDCLKGAWYGYNFTSTVNKMAKKYKENK